MSDVTSFTRSFSSPPQYYSTADYRDTNEQYYLDCTDAMTARGDSISSIGAVITTRDDGVAIATSEITVSSATILSAGAIVTLPSGNQIAIGSVGTWFRWTFSGGVAEATYILTWPLTLASGAVIYRSISISVGKGIG